jgi:serine/threonine protein kinase
VAIKVLPQEFATDADRIARFPREAKLLASLNHPNIAAIHGLEESCGTNFLSRGGIHLADDFNLNRKVALIFLTPCAAEALILLPIGDNRDRGAELSARAAKRTQQ